MNDSDGTTTSSPGRRRARCSARCSAVVQERHATPCAGADARGERLLELGHPRALGDPAGADGVGGGLRPPPRRAAGIITGIMAPLAAGVPVRRLDGQPAAGAARRVHHATRSCRPVARSISRGIHDGPAAAAEMSASRRVTPLTVRAGPCSGPQVGAHHLAAAPAASSARLVSVPLAMLNTSSVTSACGGQDVGPGDVAHVHEVHGLHAVAEDQRRLPAAMRSIQRISTSV